MEISGFDSAAYGMTETARTALAKPQTFDKLVFQTVEEQQAEKEGDQQREGSQVGLPFPGQLSREEQQRVENLKNEAMRIASQSDGNLSPGEVGQIKAIQQEIRDIGGMPMSENLMEKAKDVAEASKVEKAAEAEQNEAAMQTPFAPEGMDGETPLDGKAMAGVGMLRQKALVTAIKTLSGGSGSFASA